MSNPIKRGERKARWMLARLDAAGVEMTATYQRGGWSIELPGRDDHTAEQRAAVNDLMLFMIGYQRCAATMCRLIREREAAQ
jgi:hypothetical protein